MSPRPGIGRCPRSPDAGGGVEPGTCQRCTGGPTAVAAGGPAPAAGQGGRDGRRTKSRRRSTGPLGLCFLPAFVLIAIVPLVLSLLEVGAKVVHTLMTGELSAVPGMNLLRLSRGRDTLLARSARSSVPTGCRILEGT